MDVREIHRAIKDGNFEWRKHSLVRLAERQISQANLDKFESDFKTRRR